ncbi:endolysin [Rhodococcus phage Shagrat]|nr:endolysin [Rhodococcus phage Shagrat]
MAKLADFAAGRPNPDALKANGFDGVVRYLANSPDRGLPNKILLPEEAKAYRDRGMEVVSNWQKTKADYQGGFDAGVRDARAALDQHYACGGPGYRPIYFSVDADVNLDVWNSKVLPYLNGAASVLGKEWVGVYGGQRSMWWAEEDGFRWRWQTKGWSRYDAQGRWNASLPVQWVDGVQLRQERVDQDTVDGIGVDVNTTWADDYGQWSKASVPPALFPQPPKEANVLKPNFIEIDMYGDGGSSRNGAAVLYCFLHTQQGGPADGSGAEGLGRYCDGSNGVSYHDIVGGGKLIHCVDDDLAAWAVLAANPYSYNLCFAGSYAEWSTEQWMQRAGDIEIAAYTIVEVARRKGVPLKVVADPYVRENGIADHGFVTRVLGIGTHTDVGSKFPWTFFKQCVDKYSRGVTVEVVYRDIDREAAEAAAWIGKRLSVDPQGNGIELGMPDGEGKRAEFENGQIYWHPRIKEAHGIPNYLFESYAEYGWEMGFLGYPVGDHTVLPGGEVQAFENGVLYRQNGKEHGYYVHGYIYAAWRQAGYENSIYGYPTSLEEDLGNGSKIQHFENGDIVFSPNGTVGLKPVGGPDEVIATSH